MHRLAPLALCLVPAAALAEPGWSPTPAQSGLAIAAAAGGWVGAAAMLYVGGRALTWRPRIHVGAQVALAVIWAVFVAPVIYGMGMFLASGRTM